MARFNVPLAMPQSDIVLRSSPGVQLPPVETVWFTAKKDRFGRELQLNCRRLPPVPGVAKKGPVMFVHGAGVRANLFCPPNIITLPAMLSEAGFDVFLMNWRASIDLEPTQYTFDDAAVNDFPAAVEKILEVAGTDTLKAVVHCQGSHAFMMSLAAGLLPEVTRVVANSTAMHPKVNRVAAVKLPIALATLGKMTDYFDPQYGLYAPSFSAKLMDFMVRGFHHECDNAVCKHSSFVYGFGFPTLWSHDNLDHVTHDWITGEFAHVPVSLFQQTRECLKAGHLVTATHDYGLPTGLGVDPPATDAAIAFMTGSDNQTFEPSGIRRTFDYFVDEGSAEYDFRQFPGYGHLDVFLGEYSSVDVFPYVIDWLNG
jgi:hypothetical protein